MKNNEALGGGEKIEKTPVVSEGAERKVEDRLVEAQEKTKAELFSSVFRRLVNEIPAIMEERGLKEEEQNAVKRKIKEMADRKIEEFERWENEYLGGKQMGEQDVEHVLLSLIEEATSSVASEGDIEGYEEEIKISESIPLAEVDKDSLDKLEQFRSSASKEEFESTLNERKKFMNDVLTNLQTDIIGDVTPGLDDFDFMELDEKVRKYVAGEIFGTSKVNAALVYAYTEKWKDEPGLIGDNLKSEESPKLVAERIFNQVKNDSERYKEFKRKLKKEFSDNA